MTIQRICILGSTGSIGCSTLDVVARHPEQLSVYALTAHQNITLLAKQVQQFKPRVVVLPDAATLQSFLNHYHDSWTPEYRLGTEGLCSVAADSEVDTVMAAIVGAACLAPVLAAAQAGKRILLANKEALVAAGSLFLNAVKQSRATLIPIDSEHNAIYQCLPETIRAPIPEQAHPSILRLLLTASGGPFRTWPLDDFATITPQQACAHPNWSMGQKISVDSATMLNKGLEVIEAHWLFAMPADKIQVLIHPQSIVHSMVEYIDGSVMAQMGQPDMRTSIAFGLGFPERIQSGVPPLSFSALSQLEFEEPSLERFPCLALAFDALRTSQAACIALNASNEVAVAQFLNGQIAYLDIPRVIQASIDAMLKHDTTVIESIEHVVALDQQARHTANQISLSFTQRNHA